MTIEKKSENIFQLSFKAQVHPYLILIVFFLLGAFALLFFPKHDFFLYLNSLHTPFLDIIFPYITYLGDGWFYLILAFALIFYRVGYLLDFSFMVLAATFFVQMGKRVLFADFPRPLGALGPELIHAIEGVELHMARSFPSGHSSSAMLICFFLAIISPKASYKVVLILLAFLTGYSRIYLGQHFFTDVYAGFAVSVFCVLFVSVIRNRIGYPKWYLKKLKL